jgi:hypothetical protein
MGCWDIYCFVCGNRCYQFPNNIESYLNNKKIDKNKIHELYYHLVLTMSKETEWLNNCTLLTPDDNIYHSCKEKQCNIEFLTKDNKYILFNKSSISKPYFDKFFGGMFGVYLHDDCWKYIEQKFKIQLKYSNLPIINKKNMSPVQYISNKVFDFINYGKIEKYWDGQYFNILKLIEDSNFYLSQSPLKKNKNISQINKNIRKLKLHEDNKRVGPSVSASFYPNDSIKFGNNKKFWIKKNNKWFELNDKIIEIKFINNNKHNRFLSDLSFIGQYNTKPIFIKSIIKSKKNIETITIITIEKYLNELKSKFKFI